MFSEFSYNSITVWMIPCLSDNYVFIIHNKDLSLTIVVDPAEARPIEAFLESKKLTLNEIWITHHHHDHIGGLVELKNKYLCQVRGSNQIPGRIPALDLFVNPNTHWKIGDVLVSVLHLPGHTLDHIAYWLTDSHHSLLFSGDVLFGFGCGRLFEGTYQQLLHSLDNINHLPPSTHVFCSHEYTEKNLQFTVQYLSIEKSNASLKTAENKIHQRKTKVENLRQKNLPTVPLLLEEEQNTNLFLIAFNTGDPLNELQHIREARNHF